MLAPEQPLPGLGRALQVSCPWCGSLPLEPCVARGTERRLRLTSAHHARAELAGAPPPRIDTEGLTSLATPPDHRKKKPTVTEPTTDPPPTDPEQTGAPLSRSLAFCDVPLDLDQRVRMAETLSTAGILPDHLRGKPGNVLAIAFAAHSLNIPMWPAIQEMHAIDGKIGISANLMRALWQRAGHKFRIIERTSERCTIEASRDGDDPYRLTFEIEDAITAGLCSRDKEGVIRARSSKNHPLNWEKYTKAMLVARATSAILREMGSDVLMGFGYTPEELGAENYLAADGAVHVVTTVEESEEVAAARRAAVQEKWDACMYEIGTAPDEAALRALWQSYNEQGIVRRPVEGQTQTLEQAIIARREALAQDAAAEGGEKPPAPPPAADGQAQGATPSTSPAAAAPSSASVERPALEGRVIGRDEPHPSEGPADESGDEVFR